MRGFLRLVASGASVIFLALLVLTTETAADELGFVSKVRAFVRGGWQAVTDSGYVVAVHAGFWFSLGVATTLWVDYLIRKARTGHAGRSMAIFDLNAEFGRELVDDLRVEFASILKSHEGKYIVDLQFLDNKPRYIVTITADAPADWTELIKTENHLRVAVWAQDESVEMTALSVMARPYQVNYDVGHITQFRELQVAYMNKRYSVLRSRGGARPLEWL